MATSDRDLAQVKKYVLSLLTSTPLKCTIYHLCRDYENHIGEEIPYRHFGYKSVQEFLYSIPDTVVVYGVGRDAEVKPVISNKTAHISQMVAKQRMPKKGNTNMPVGSKRVTDCYQLPRPVAPLALLPTPHVSQCSRPNLNMKYLNTSPRFDQRIRLLPPNFQFHRGLNLHYQPQYQPRFRNLPAILPAGTDIQSCNNRPRIPEKIPVHVENNLESLMSSYAEKGIRVTELPNAYWNKYCQPLRFREYGFPNLMEMIKSLPKIFHYVPFEKSDFILYGRNKPISNHIDKQSNNNMQPSTSKALAIPSTSKATLNKPKYKIFDYGEHIERGFLPDSIVENNIIEVVVTEIYDPSKFWINLQNPELDELKADMRQFYKNNHHDYLVCKSDLRSGLYCAHFHRGEYQRALILDTLPNIENQIQVLFIDTGTMTKLSFRGVCYLLQDFAKLPMQAIRARMADICPCNFGLPWTSEVTEKFEELVLHRDLSAKIVKINRNISERYVEVRLMDSTDKISLNDSLVEDGLAQYAHKGPKKTYIDANFTAIHKQIHLYPTFVDIESGLVPGVVEMKVMHALQVSVNFCYPQYFHQYIENDVDNIDNYLENPIEALEQTQEIYIHSVREIKFALFGAIETDVRKFVAENDEFKLDEPEEPLVVPLKPEPPKEEVNNIAPIAADISSAPEEMDLIDFSEEIEHQEPRNPPATVATTVSYKSYIDEVVVKQDPTLPLRLTSSRVKKCTNPFLPGYECNNKVEVDANVKELFRSIMKPNIKPNSHSDPEVDLGPELEHIFSYQLQRPRRRVLPTVICYPGWSNVYY